MELAIFGMTAGLIVLSRSSSASRRRAVSRPDPVVRKLVKPKAARFTLLIKLTASVGPLLTWAACQAAIWCFHCFRVRPSDRASTG